jgi:polar amino acid transport system substrate-binding protein
MMKKFLLLAMTLLKALSLVAGCGSDSPKKMVIGLDDNFAPMGFRNEKNEIVGYDIDLAKEACKRAGMEVEFKPIFLNAGPAVKAILLWSTSSMKRFTAVK